MKQYNGDIFAGEWNGMVHCANLHNVMGGGIARLVRSKFPEAYEADGKVVDPQLGHFSFASVCVCQEFNIEAQIFNLYGQFGIGNDGHPMNRNVRYDAIHDGVWRICEFIVEKFPNECYNLAFPYGMGSALAGGDWKIVSAILESIESHFPNIQFNIYKL